MEEQRESPSVIPRSDVPISSAPEDGELEVRPFGAHAILSGAVPDNIAMAWTYARHGQDVGVRSHPEPGLLIVLQGKARLIGATRKPVEQGDVITVPKRHEYGFTDVGRQGLLALHVAFQTDSETRSPTEARTLDELLARNEARARASTKGPLYQLLRNDALSTERRRSMMREGIRVFSDAFQTMLFTRQATCRDEVFRSVFDEHLFEEIGHNKLLKVKGDWKAAADPILKATSSWFCHQMLVLDNAEKAVVHLVVETGGHYFHTLAKSVFENDESAEYFGAHAEHDEDHKELAIDVLKDDHPLRYAKLSRVLEDSWDMLEAMCARIATLVQQT